MPLALTQPVFVKYLLIHWLMNELNQFWRSFFFTWTNATASSVNPIATVIPGMSSSLCETFSSVQLLSCVQLFSTPWIAARLASLSLTIFWSLPKFTFTESVMPSNHLILCHPLLLPPSIFPSIRVFPNESPVRIRWPKYWSFSLSIGSSNEFSGLIFFRIDWLDLLAV